MKADDIVEAAKNAYVKRGSVCVRFGAVGPSLDGPSIGDLYCTHAIAVTELIVYFYVNEHLVGAFLAPCVKEVL